MTGLVGYFGFQGGGRHGESGDGRDSPNWISAGNSDGWVGRYISLV